MVSFLHPSQPDNRRLSGEPRRSASSNQNAKERERPTVTVEGSLPNRASEAAIGQLGRTGPVPRGARQRNSGLVIGAALGISCRCYEARENLPKLLDRLEQGGFNQYTGTSGAGLEAP